MKYPLALLTTVVLIATVVGCGGSDEESAATTVAASPMPTKSDPAQRRAGEPGEVGAARQGRKRDRSVDVVSGFRVVPKPTKSQLAIEPGGDNSLQTFGNEAGGGDLAEILDAMRAYFEALGSGDYEAACPHVAAPFASQLTRYSEEGRRQTGRPGLGGCPAIADGMATISKQGPTRSEANLALTGSVLRVGFEDDEIRNTAIVIFRHRDGSALYSFTMRREDDAWKAVALVPTPWPYS